MTPDLDTINSFYINQADSSQTMVDVAYGSSLYFTVWSDQRAGFHHTYGARVTPVGIVLDTNGILIGPASNSTQWQPSVVYANNSFFTIWGYYEYPGRLTGKFISPAGTPLSDTLPIAVADGPVEITRIAFDGTHFLVAWTEFNQSTGWSRAKGQLVSGTGIPTGNSFMIADSVYGDRSLGLKFDGSHYLVTFSKQVTGVFQVMGCFYDTSGQTVGSIFRISNSVDNCVFSDAALSRNGNCLNVWTMNFGNYDIYGNVDVQFGIDERSTTMVIDKKKHTTGMADLYAQPNPFSLKTFIKWYIAKTESEYNLPRNNKSELRIFDIAGKAVKTYAPLLCDQVIWDGTDNTGIPVPPGVYFLRLDTPFSSYCIICKVIKTR